MSRHILVAPCRFYFMLHPALRIGNPPLPPRCMMDLPSILLNKYCNWKETMGDWAEGVWCRLILCSSALFFFSFLFICIIYNSYGETQMSELHLSLFNISI